jgi:4-nitrophenyl phosphatase
MPDCKRVYVIGEQALLDSLRDGGFELVERDADAVVVGLDRALTYQKLERATLEIRRGAKFIATNRDHTLPTEKGLIPGAGSIIAALVAATDVEPIVIGKPGHPMFELALAITRTNPETTAMLGDRLDTDIDGAAELGLTTILVLTGVSTRADAEQNRAKPDVIVDDLPTLVRVWSQA